jgi:predicted nucleic acid-binding protein
MAKKIFVDTSVLYAFVDRADRNHVQAIKTLEMLSVQGVYLYTSFHSISDAAAAVTNQLGTTLGFDFIQAMTETSMEVLYPQKNDFQSAFKLMKFNKDRQITLKQALTAVLMQKRGINEIFTFSFWHNLLGSKSYLVR